MGELARHCSVVVVRCARLRLALPLVCLRKVVPTPRMTPLPDAPDGVCGLINLHGAPLVVFDSAGMTSGAGDQPSLSTQVAIVEANPRPFGLLCDEVVGIHQIDAAGWQPLRDVLPGVGYLAAAAPGLSDVLVMRDPDRWLSDDKARDLQVALDRHVRGASAPSAP